MALSKSSVYEAKQILWQVFPDSHRTFQKIDELEEIMSFNTPTAFGLGEKADGGFENVFVAVQHVTDQEKLNFWAEAAEVPNTPFCRLYEDSDNVTLLGWY